MGIAMAVSNNPPTASNFDFLSLCLSGNDMLEVVVSLPGKNGAYMIAKNTIFYTLIILEG